jgi:predicted dienelactone hydrolase
MRGGFAAFFFALAVAATAAAQDGCLSGDATLGDQRALAMLRTTVEANCPCVSFTGPLGRRAYARCVRGAIRDALLAGTLRGNCVRAAQALYRTAVCGTNRVACGDYRLTDYAASCRLAAPSGHNGCGGRPEMVETACGAQTRCADVVDATAGTCLDPRQAGPYGVGVRTVDMTKDSVVNPGTPRVLETLVWYPTAPDTGLVDPMLKGVVDAPLDLSGAPYPMLLFSHGSCGYAYQSTFLTPLLASYGIVVVAPPHPGNTLFDGPSCGSVDGQLASAQERPADIIFATDQMLAATGNTRSPFFGTIDPQRVGMSGHSFGGLTTYLVVDRDARYRIAVPMAPAVFNVIGLQIPSLTMFGQIDSVVQLPPIRAAYAAASDPKIKVEIAHAGHYAFSDGCFPSADCNFPTTLSQDEAHAAVQRWVVPFVLRYLAGDLRVEPLLDAVPPGVDVAQER